MAATNQSSSNKLEIDFLEENLESCSVENRYFSGYFDGKRDEFEDMLERFLLISSTFFIKKALNQRSKIARGFRKMVGSFFCFKLIFCFYQFGVGLVET